MGIRLVASHVHTTMASAVIVDMAEQIAARILRYRNSEISTDRPEDQPDLVIAVVGRVQAAQHDEAAAVANFLEMLRELWAECRQREIAASNFGQCQAMRIHTFHR